MWRALFLAVGTYLMIFGLECLGVERVTLKMHDPPPLTAAGAGAGIETPPKEGPQSQFTPAPWVPWSLLSSGAVVCLYSFTIPRRMGK